MFSSSSFLFFGLAEIVKRICVSKMTNKRRRRNKWIFSFPPISCTHICVCFFRSVLSYHFMLCFDSFRISLWNDSVYCICISWLFGPQLRHRIIYICVFIIGRRDFSLSLAPSISVAFFSRFWGERAQIYGEKFRPNLCVSFPYSLSLSTSLFTLCQCLCLFRSSVRFIRCTLFSVLFLKCIVLRFKLYRSRCVESALTTHT